MEDEERYEIKGKVGEGGRGAVYRAYDRQLNRSVAIKRLFPEDGVGDGNEAVMKESHALSAINSPHIVRVFDVAQDEEGPYVVMEFLDGKTLHEVVSKAPLVPEDFKTVAEQSLEALIAAHEAKLLHRDIKPSNLMLTWLPSGRIQLKLLDFGLAKFTETPAIQTVAQKGSVLGSIYFMAPEQFERTALDVRSDLYSLGCVLYYSLTGVYPFSGESVTEVMAAHIQGSCDNLASHRPDISPALCGWVMSLVARNQDDRPASAHAALESFELARKATAPVTNQPIPSGPRLITGSESDSETQQINTAPPTATQLTNTLLTTATVPVTASTNTRTVPSLVPTQTTATTALLAAKTKSNAIPPWVMVVCSVLLVSIIALSMAVAMRGDPAKSAPDPDPTEAADPDPDPGPTKPPPPVVKKDPKPTPPKKKTTPKKTTPPKKPQKWDAGAEFLKKDQNGDFKLSLGEYTRNRKDGEFRKHSENFKKLDRDGNGFLTLGEYKNRKGLRLSK